MSWMPRDSSATAGVARTSVPPTLQVAMSKCGMREGGWARRVGRHIKVAVLVIAVRKKFFLRPVHFSRFNENG